jgi:hypothetical protein
MYRSIFISSRESETISNISKGLTKYGYDMEAAMRFANDSIKAAYNIASKNNRYSIAIRNGAQTANDLVQAGITRTTEGIKDAKFVSDIKGDLGAILERNGINMDLSRVKFSEKEGIVNTLLNAFSREAKAKKMTNIKLGNTHLLLQKLAPEIDAIFIKRTNEYLERVSKGIDEYLASDKFVARLNNIGRNNNNNFAEVIKELEIIARFNIVNMSAEVGSGLTKGKGIRLLDISGSVANKIIQNKLGPALRKTNLHHEQVQQLLTKVSEKFKYDMNETNKLIAELKAVRTPIKNITTKRPSGHSRLDRMGQLTGKTGPYTPSAPKPSQSVAPVNGQSIDDAANQAKTNVNKSLDDAKQAANQKADDAKAAVNEPAAKPNEPEPQTSGNQASNQTNNTNNPEPNSQSGSGSNNRGNNSDNTDYSDDGTQYYSFSNGPSGTAKATADAANNETDKVVNDLDKKGVQAGHIIGWAAGIVATLGIGYLVFGRNKDNNN